MLEHSRAQNGRSYGYVMGSGEPVATLAELAAAALNQNVTSWRSAPAATTIERARARSAPPRRRCLKLWLSLRFHGLEAFRASIREDLELAQELATS